MNYRISMYTQLSQLLLNGLILWLDSIEILNKFFNLHSVFVLYSEVLRFGLNLPYLCLHLVLFLNISCELIEIFFEINDLLVYFFGNLIFLGLIEDVFFNLGINCFYFFNQIFCLLLNIFDFGKNILDFNFLCFQIRDNFIDSLQILISIDILWLFIPLALEIHQHLFLVLKLLDCLLDLLLDVFYFVHFVLVFNFLWGDVFLLLSDLICYGFLDLVPFCSQFIQLIVELSNLRLKNFEVLTFCSGI